MLHVLMGLGTMRHMALENAGEALHPIAVALLKHAGNDPHTEQPGGPTGKPALKAEAYRRYAKMVRTAKDRETICQHLVVLSQRAAKEGAELLVAQLIHLVVYALGFGMAEKILKQEGITEGMKKVLNEARTADLSKGLAAPTMQGAMLRKVRGPNR